jgi:2-polyprenyl-6-hydroxyphenyl methylase/3-demethylubiquinone-9 3-methyltransferase
VAAGERFEFGRNWRLFLASLDEERIASAERSLRQMLGLTSLAGKRFLDAGSGSGLFSLAARRLGATVHSFDYDPQSVACTAELRRRYFPGDPDWAVGQGSVLDESYLSGLGAFDVVYSWGVLHHTGAMWRALANVAPLVAENGRLFLAIYNDQGKPSRRWLRVKKAYNGLPSGLRFLVLWPAFWRLWWRRLLKDLLCGRPLRTWREYAANRGMSPWRDVVDWVGGFPFEVAKPERIFEFYHQRGFELAGLSTQGGDLGCNEFVFVRKPGKSAE